MSDEDFLYEEEEEGGELVPVEYDRFFRREDNVPVVNNQKISFEPRCRVCKIHNTLMVDKGYTEEQANEVEKQMYRMIYSFWDSTEISRWLYESYEIEISHDSLSRHRNLHIPDPHAAMVQRVMSYKPKITRRAFEGAMLDTMRLVLVKFRDDMADGVVEIKPRDFILFAEKYKEFVEEFDDQAEDQMMEALKRTLERVMTDPVQQREFLSTLREEIEEGEDEETQ